MKNSTGKNSPVKLPALKHRDEFRFNENFAVYGAMLKAGYKQKAKLKPAEFARRQAVESLLQQKRYCEAFEVWRDCAKKSCRRHHACGGDAHRCLKRAVARVPHHEQWRARQRILNRTPRNIGAPERAARQSMPVDFYE
jgi:hypothetical protein